MDLARISLKSVFLSSIGAILFSAGNAHASWIKITLAGNITSGLDDGGMFSNWSFAVLPYALTSTSPGPGGVGSVQTVPKYGIGYNPPLFGFSSFVGTGFSGEYNAFGDPNGSDYLSFTNATPSVISFKTGRQPTTQGEATSGISYNYQQASGSDDVKSIEFSGGMSESFNPGGVSGEQTITGLITSALSKSPFSSPQTFTCVSGCGTGKLNLITEDPFDFTWTSITFESLEGVPAPAPIAGGVYFFYFSKRLRVRTKAAK